jgi:FkbM family methyltransferase
MRARALFELAHHLQPFLPLQRQLARGRRAPLYSALFAVRVIRRHVLLAVANRIRGLADRPIPMHAQNLTFFVGPTLDESGPLFEVFRTHLYDRLPGFAAQQGDVVVDIGANIGAFSLFQAQRGAIVYAYEPNPACFERLSRAIEHNHLAARVYASNQAVGAVVGHGTLEVLPMATPSGVMHWDPAGPTRVTTLAEICAVHNLAQIDLLKIDTEGSELAILQGAGDTLARVQRVLLEYHSTALLDACSRLLAQHGFVIEKHLRQVPLPQVGVLYASRAPGRRAAL